MLPPGSGFGGSAGNGFGDNGEEVMASWLPQWAAAVAVVGALAIGLSALVYVGVTLVSDACSVALTHDVVTTAATLINPVALFGLQLVRRRNRRNTGKKQVDDDGWRHPGSMGGSVTGYVGGTGKTAGRAPAPLPAPQHRPPPYNYGYDDFDDGDTVTLDAEDLLDDDDAAINQRGWEPVMSQKKVSVPHLLYCHWVSADTNGSVYGSNWCLY